MKRVMKASPFMFFTYYRPFLYVLILPVALSLAQFLRGGGFSASFLPEIIAAAILAAVSLLRLKSFSLTVEKELLTVRFGVLLRQTAVVRTENITVLRLRRTVLCMLFGATKVMLNTEAGLKGNDFTFYLSRREANALAARLFKKESINKHDYSPYRVALMAASTSSAVSGGLIAVPFFKSAVTLFGEQMRDKYLDALTPPLLYRYLSPLGAAVTMAIALFFFIGFLNILLRFLRLHQTGRKHLHIRYGLFSCNDIYFCSASVNAVITEQNLFMRLLSLRSLKVEIGGINAGRGDSAVISPALSQKKFSEILSDSFPFLCVLPLDARPKKGTLWRFWYFPALRFIGMTAAVVIFRWLFPALTRFDRLTAVLIGFVTLYSLYLGMFNYRHGGVGSDGKSIYAVNTLFGVKKELFCLREKVGFIRISKSPADRRYGTCSVLIRTQGESGAGLRVRYVDDDKMRNIAE